MLLAFDIPTPFTTMGRRNVSNVPAQALILMNDPFVHRAGRDSGPTCLAAHHAPTPSSASPHVPRRLRAAPADANGRGLPSSTTSNVPTNRDDPSAWADLAHVLINIKEFIFVEL